MVNASKILTVSYGTFSCTLEGFDDPFSTMRSIAEYFRDLAADDRYFGAEPPTPDAEMLHRIAEREIQHRVEARVEDNNVVLRQADSIAPTGAATLVAGEALLDDTLDDEAAAPKQDESPPQDAAKATVPHAADEISDESIDETDGPDEVSEVAQYEDDDLPADLTDSSIAAKLRRIRAVVDNRAADTTREDRENGLGDDFFNDITDEYEPLIDVDAETDSDDQFEAEEFVEEEILETSLSDDAASEILSGISAALLEDDDDAGDDADQPADEPDQGNLQANDTLAEDDEDEDDADPEFEDENVFAEDDDPQPKPVAIARVVKVRRKQPAPVEELEEMGEGNTMLSPEDEAALMAELAEVARDAEFETAADDQDQNDSSPIRTAFDDGDFEGADALDRIMAETNSKLESDEVSQKRTSIAHLRAAVQAKRALGDDADNADDNADDYRHDLARVVHPRRPAIKGGQSSRRLAPLVLVSEQRVDEPDAPEAEADTTPVRPRRVRKVTPDDIQPVKQAENAGADTEEAFNAFAVQVGAKSPIEIIEAAAAWRIFVREQETFSRPQVMRLLLKSDPSGELTREEGLRAFGKLIREGVIEKIQRGRYTISEHSQYRPGKNRASA